MLRLDSCDRRDMITDIAIGIIAESGMGAVTLRSLAQRIGVTPPALLHWFGNRDHVLMIIASTFSLRWRQWVMRRMYEHDLCALLPATDEEVAWTRVWLSLGELGRHHEEVGLWVEEARDFEEELIDREYQGALSPHERAATLALVEGLRVALCRPTSSLQPDEARQILFRALELLPERPGRPRPASPAGRE